MSDFLEPAAQEPDHELRERGLALKEREQATSEAHLAIAQKTSAVSLWRSPVVVAILAAAVAAVGNAVVVYENASSQRTLEGEKAEQARILEVIKTGNPDRAAENLRFLLDTGLIVNPGVRRDLRRFLSRRTPGGGPALPAASDAAKLASKFEGESLRPFKDSGGLWVIGAGHVLTPGERRTGRLVIAGKAVDYRAGISREQALRLLDQDLAPARKDVERLVTVELTKNQEDALTSFVFNAGGAALKRSELLKKLNAGGYDEVPQELMRFVRFGGQVIPGLVERRRSEVALWNKH